MNARRFHAGALVLLALILAGAWPAAAAGGPLVYAGPCSDSSFLIDGAGALSAWGINGAGNLGIGSYVNQSSPFAVPFPAGVHRWRAVAAGNSFSGAWTYAIGDDSQLYGTGYVYGPGNVPASYPKYLTLVPPPSGVGGWIAVAAGSQGWLALATNGSVYGNVNGAVAWPPRAGATSWTQVAVCAYISPSQLDLFALDNAGRIYGVNSGTAWFPSPVFTLIPIPAGATAWTNLIAGGDFVLAQANDGNLYGWGNNLFGQLGQGSGYSYTNAPQRIALPAGKTGWLAVSAGGEHVLATTTDGQLFAWGYNTYGQLGLGDTRPGRYAPAAVPNLTNVTAIAAGVNHSLAVTACAVLAWGENTFGELGAGFTSSYYPQPINVQFSYDICSTNPPQLPLVSIMAADSYAAEGTWLSTLGPPATNTGMFVISRSMATASSLVVQLVVGGTASNGVDYAAMPSTITIPAGSNSVSLLVVPTGDTLAVTPATVVVSLAADAAYQLGDATNAVVTLSQYESQGTPPLPPTGLQFQIFVGTNLNGQVFDIQSSTNLINWTDLGTGTNVWGIVTVTETNRLLFRQRFFRSFPVPGQ